MSGYITVAKRSNAEITEKKSRFITTVVPIKSEEEAVSVLNEVRKEYPDAGHSVYAYSIRKNNMARYSDAGEPAQTAGLPIMDMIKKIGMTDVIVVVTRYFGGILLGTGGLVHAYTKAAKEGLIAAEPVKMTLCREILIKCDYTLLGKVQNYIITCGYHSDEPEYSDLVSILVFVPEEDEEKFVSEVVDLTNGRAKLNSGDVKYQPITQKFSI